MVVFTKRYIPIGGQVRLVGLVRLQTDNLHLFFCHQTDNDKLKSVR
jgi:hypothetical protein